MVTKQEFYDQICKSVSCMRCPFSAKYHELEKQFPNEELPEGFHGCLCDEIQWQIKKESK